MERTLADLDSFFSGLAPVIRLAKDARARVDRVAATGFSTFEYFSENENALSRIFGDLLDPRGSHGQGTLFLKHFVEHFMGELDGCWRHEEKLAECRVGLEVVTTRAKQRRRLDIVLEFPESVIGIENKPWAIDQENQLVDYIAHLNPRDKWAMLYLSGSGDPPSKDSLHRDCREKFIENGQLRVIPFCMQAAGHPPLETWLEACIRDCEAERVRWFLKDFLAYIRHEFGSCITELATEVSMTAEYIKGQPEVLKSALMVEAAMPGVRQYLVEKFLNELESVLLKDDPSSEWVVHKSYDNPDSPDKKIMGNWAVFVLRKRGWTWEKGQRPDGVAIATDAVGWGKVFLGVSCHEEDLTIKIRDKLKGHHPGPTKGWVTWSYPEEYLQDWRGEKFLLRIAEEKGRTALAEDLANRMRSLVGVVEDVFDRKNEYRRS
jgi:hypothetical protein